MRLRDGKRRRWLLPYQILVICSFALATLICMIASWTASLGESDGKRAHCWLVRWAKTTLALAGLEVRVAGLERLDPRKNYLFMPNHASFLDILLSFAYIPFDFRIVTKQEMFSIPLIGWSLKRSRQIPLDRANPRSGLMSLRQAAEWLKRGHSIVVFPEGTRTPDGDLQEFKPTLFLLPIRSGVPVVPVLIEGTFEALRRGRVLLNPVPLKLTFLDPLPPTSFTDQGRALYAQRTRETLIAALAAGSAGSSLR